MFVMYIFCFFLLPARRYMQFVIMAVKKSVHVACKLTDHELAAFLKWFFMQNVLAMANRDNYQKAHAHTEKGILNFIPFIFL